MGKKKGPCVGVPTTVPAPAPAPGVSRAQKAPHRQDCPDDPSLSSSSSTSDAATAAKVGPLPQRPPQQYPAARQQGTLNPQAQDHHSARSAGSSRRYSANGINKHSRYTPPQTRSQDRTSEVLAADKVLPSNETPSYADSSHQRRQNHTDQAPSATPRLAERHVSPPRAPSPSKSYLAHTNAQPERLAQPRKLLVLLDLNGTLLYRSRLDKAGQWRREHILRPGARELISYLFNNHAVMVYTSAMRRNAVLCVDALLKHLAPAQRSQLIGIRPREQLGLSHAQLNAKVQVYKPLEPVWRLKTVQASARKQGCGAWDVTNTVLLDDSPEKARANPHSLLQLPEFKPEDSVRQGTTTTTSTTTTTTTTTTAAAAATTNLSADAIKTETTIMQRVQARLEDLKWEVSVARRIRVWQEQKTTLVDSPDEDISAAAAYPTPETMPASDDDSDDNDGDDNVDDNGNDNNDDDDSDNDNDNDDDDDDDEDGGVPLVYSDSGPSCPIPLDRFKNLNLGQG